MRIFKTKAFHKFAVKNAILAEQYAQLTPQQIEDSVRNGYFIEVKQEA